MKVEMKFFEEYGKHICWRCWHAVVESYWLSEPYLNRQSLVGLCRNCELPRDDVYHGISRNEIEVLLVMNS